MLTPHNTPFKVKEGAILVADAHYANYRPQFKVLLEQILSGALQTSQIILLGDNVDLLVAKVAFFEKHEKEIIGLLNDVAEIKEVIYLEGNHDFMLKGLFPKIQIVPLKAQPMYAEFNGKYGWLAHGDWNEPFSYRAYTFLQRNRVARFIYSGIDKMTKNALSQALRTKMRLKPLCRKFENFETVMRRKFSSVTINESWFIEGHYHQGVELSIGSFRYFNLDAMACNKSFFVVQSKDNEMGLSKRILVEG